MSEYLCFNCGKTQHTSDLRRIESRHKIIDEDERKISRLVTLLCRECEKNIFVENEIVNEVKEEAENREKIQKLKDEKEHIEHADIMTGNEKERLQEINAKLERLENDNR